MSSITAQGIANQMPMVGNVPAKRDYVILNGCDESNPPVSIKIHGTEESVAVVNEGNEDFGPMFNARGLSFSNDAQSVGALIKLQDGSEVQVQINIERVC